MTTPDDRTQRLAAIEQVLADFFNDRFVYVVDPSGVRLSPQYLAEVTAVRIDAAGYVRAAEVAADPIIAGFVQRGETASWRTDLGQTGPSPLWLAPAAPSVGEAP